MFTISIRAMRCSREVTIIDENEEYCIVESNNIYGLAAYDYIVLRADEVTEDQIVY